MTLIAALSGGLLVTGVLGIVFGLRPHEVKQPRVRPQRSRPRTRRRLVALGGVLAGAMGALLTGWLVLIVLIPAAALLAWNLWLRRTQPRVARIEALSEFARAVAGVLGVGRGLEEAITQAARSAPATLEEEVNRLASRIRANWDTGRALRAFADDVDDATGDLLVATLIMASQRRGPGVASAIQGVAESIEDEVRARREVETEQKKPQTAGMIITIISASLLIGLFVTGDYVAPYTSVVGQVLLLLYLSLYLVLLAWMARLTQAPRLPRFMGSSSSEEARS